MYVTDLSLSKARSNNKIYLANLARFEATSTPPNSNFKHNKERKKRACKLKVAIIAMTVMLDVLKMFGDTSATPL